MIAKFGKYKNIFYLCQLVIIVAYSSIKIILPTRSDMKIGHLVLIASLLGIVFGTNVNATEPSGYYSACEGKSGAALLSALNSKIGSHTNVGYDGLWNVYKTSDVKPNGKIWDMYSTKEWPVNSERCGNYKNVGDCYNREHSFPKSWFDDRSPMVSDAFHIYPTDGKVNGQRSNFPYGECANGTTLSSNGGVKALGKLGASTYPGYSGKVFEPVDEYKGDFARTYFYMAACYNDKIAGWNSDMLAGNKFPAFKSWAINLLMKWHRQDPVSQKEIDRNDAVYQYQKNRNPFIDHPELAEHIWGDKSSTAWYIGGVADPVISFPVNGSVVDLGLTGIGVERAATVIVRGSNLTDDVAVAVSGAGFSVSDNTLSASAANSTSGARLKVSYISSSEGEGTGTVTFKSGAASTAITVKAHAVSGIPAKDATDVSENSFDANWVSVDESGTVYQLHVLCGDVELSNSPIEVLSDDENCTVGNLTPGTTYTYYLTCGSRTSNKVSVITAFPVPSIQFLYDGDLYFTTAPGTPSQIAEILLDIDNIDGDINLRVASPFELSTDKSSWTATVTLAPEEDRFYLRLNSMTAGSFSTTVEAVAGEYVNDDLTVEGVVASTPTFMETFEIAPDGQNSYNPNGFEYQGAAAVWNLTGVGVFTDSRDIHTGKQGARFNKTAGSVSRLEMTEGKPHGVGIVTFWAKAWSGESGTVNLDYSTDAGITWHTAGRFSISDDAWKQYSATVNVTGDVRLRFDRQSGKRIGLDDVEATDYAMSAVDELDYHQWDAFCRDSVLVIENYGDDINCCVYGTDGITWFNDTVRTGETGLTLPSGLYIVVINDFPRRVVVK